MKINYKNILFDKKAHKSTMVAWSACGVKQNGAIKNMCLIHAVSKSIMSSQ